MPDEPTNQVTLEDVAQAMAAAAPGVDHEGRRVIAQTHRLLATGEPVPTTFFASEESGLAWTEEHPGTFLLSMADAFELGRLTNRLRWGEIEGA